MDALYLGTDLPLLEGHGLETLCAHAELAV